MLKNIKSSLRSSVALTVLVMGVVGVALAVVTGEVYRHITFDSQRQSIAQFVEIKIQDIIANTIDLATELSLSTQSTPMFKAAIKNQDNNKIRIQLDEQFHRFFVTSSIIQLQKLFAFDNSLQLIGYSSEGSERFGPNNIPCAYLIDQAANRTGAARLKVLSALCSHNESPTLTVLVPIGGLHVEGYLLAAIDPVRNLTKAEKDLAMPLRISSINSGVVFQSAQWPTQFEAEKSIVSEYQLRGDDAEPLYHLEFVSDTRTVYKKLENTRLLIVLAAGVATLFTALVSLLVLQKTTINPLSILTQHLQRVREDKQHLGERVVVSGNLEIRELAEDFNTMSSELHSLYKTLENMAFADSLTGLPNRALFYERLDQAVMEAKSKKLPFLLLMLDLNRFKYINDTLGHHIGDQLLQEVAKRLCASVRKSDTIARLGGDEFAAIIPSIDDFDAAKYVATKILKALSEPVKVEQHSLTVGASIGIVRCPGDGLENNQLMQRADVAMYHAKNNHYGFTFYNRELDKHNIIQLNLESDLVSAIDNNGLLLHYQPKIDLRTQQIVSVEALLRWNHPRLGYISPEEFVPLAEHAGLIQTLTRWVLLTALTECAKWHVMGIKIGVAVNLSARSLEDTTIVDVVSSILVKTGMQPRWLSLELTESAVMADPNHAMSLLLKLNEMGVQISIDDFGTGYSSLAYLKKLPVDELKIDKSFVMDMNQDSSDEVIVHSTIDLAHNMGLVVTAEGVENQLVRDKLVKLGCNFAQGFHMCRPCDAKTLNHWLKDSPLGIKKTIVKVI